MTSYIFHSTIHLVTKAQAFKAEQLCCCLNGANGMQTISQPSAEKVFGCISLYGRGLDVYIVKWQATGKESERDFTRNTRLG